MYPSEWDPETWRNVFLNKEAKKMRYWDKFGSILARNVADLSIKQSAGSRILNSLDITLKNIHIQLIDNHIAGTPFGFEACIDEIKVTPPNLTDPVLTRKRP